MEHVPLADRLVAVDLAEAGQRPVGDVLAPVGDADIAAVFVIGVERETLGLLKS
jgi:hypothetical protein